MALTFTTGNTFVAGDVVTATKMNAQVNSTTYAGALEVAKGGTAGVTAAAARTNLDVPSNAEALLAANNLSDLASLATAKVTLGVVAPIKATAELVSTDTTLADITGMTVNVVSGTTYTMTAHFCYSWTGSTGFGKFNLTGTATVSSINGAYCGCTSAAVPFGGVITSPLPVLLSSVGSGSNGAGLAIVTVTFVCDGSGTLKWQFAQANDAGTSTCLLGTYMTVQAY
jgi:hypothetical protein